MKVYVVNVSLGQYDDHRIVIDGVYKNPSDAEERCKKIDAEHKALLDTPEPFPIEEYETRTRVEQVNYDKWEWDRMKSEEFNRATVKEFELK